MTVYLFGCSKGGVGKSTLAVNSAAHLALEGRRVCIVDADEQLHASAWCTTRLANHPTLPRIHDKAMKGSIGKAVRTLVPEYDDIVVDAGGHDSQEMRSAMTVADVIAMPFSASQFDLYAVETMDQLVSDARAFNEGLRAVAFLNKVDTNWVRSKTAAAALEFLASFEGIHRANALVYFRPAPYEAVAESGRSVFELGRSGEKAANEVATLMAELTGDHAATTPAHTTH
jgi:chromosome partitioning protein